MKGKIDLYNVRFKRSKMCKIISKCLKLYITLKNMIFLKKMVFATNSDVLFPSFAT